MDELLANLREAIEGCLSVDVEAPFRDGKERELEIAISGASAETRALAVSWLAVKSLNLGDDNGQQRCEMGMRRFPNDGFNHILVIVT